MRKWLNWIGLGLMAAAAASMIAADAMAGEPSHGWEPTAQKCKTEHEDERRKRRDQARTMFHELFPMGRKEIAGIEGVR